MKDASDVCFVFTDPPRSGLINASARWLGYVAGALGAARATFGEIERGFQQQYAVYVLEREVWRFPLLGRKRTLVWLDDAYHLLPRLALNYHQWQNGWLTALRLGLRHAQGVITPNPYLTADYADLVHESYFIPNYHDFPAIAERGVHERVLGWAGTTNHVTSWRDTNLAAALGAYPIQIVGNAAVAELVRRQHDPALVSESAALESVGAYLQRVAHWGAYLIPVQGVYDRRRSWIKALEACYCGTPWLAYGDANLIYRDVPFGLLLDQNANLNAALEQVWTWPISQQLEAAFWAETQRITYHLDEWRKALYG